MIHLPARDERLAKPSAFLLNQGWLDGQGDDNNFELVTDQHR